MLLVKRLNYGLVMIMNLAAHCHFILKCQAYLLQLLVSLAFEKVDPDRANTSEEYGSMMSEAQCCPSAGYLQQNKLLLD